jgi:hypothetical protein
MTILANNVADAVLDGVPAKSADRTAVTGPVAIGGRVFIVIAPHTG